MTTPFSSPLRLTWSPSRSSTAEAAWCLAASAPAAPHRHRCGGVWGVHTVWKSGEGGASSTVLHAPYQTRLSSSYPYASPPHTPPTLVFDPSYAPGPSPIHSTSSHCSPPPLPSPVSPPHNHPSTLPISTQARAPFTLVVALDADGKAAGDPSPPFTIPTQARDPFTLVVALDADGKATGDLFLDDGSSFAFKRGQYVHRCGGQGDGLGCLSGLRSFVLGEWEPYPYNSHCISDLSPPSPVVPPHLSPPPRRDFSFEGLRLRSSAHHEPGAQVSEPVAPQSGAWDGADGLLVERVVLLGLPKSAKGYSAKLPGGEVGA